MTYNVFGGTLSLTQSINHCEECYVVYSVIQRVSSDHRDYTESVCFAVEHRVSRLYVGRDENVSRGSVETRG